MKKTAIFGRFGAILAAALMTPTVPAQTAQIQPGSQQTQAPVLTVDRINTDNREYRGVRQEKSRRRTGGRVPAGPERMNQRKRRKRERQTGRKCR